MKIRLFYLILLLSGSIMAQVGTVQEGFETWPPTDWEEYLLGVVNNGWLQDFESISHTGDHSAHANISNDQCDHWLVTPQIQVNTADYNLKFWEYHRDATYYDKASVWISTGSGDPNDGDFIELFETPQPITQEVWEERSLDLSSYDQQDIYIAFRYEGTWHRWYVDDVNVGPDSYTDLGVDQIVNPTGVSPDPGMESVTILVSNYGDTAIDQLQVDWWVNGMPQPAYATAALGLEPGGSMEITVGDYNFDSPGLYNLSFDAVAADDFDASNNQITGTYTISEPSDMALIHILPQGNHPEAGMHDVSVRVKNVGNTVIDNTTILWEVDGNVQTDVVLSGIGLQPGQEQYYDLGTYNFTTGFHQIEAVIQALGDINAENDQIAVPLTIDSFFEGFEGTQMPPHNWDLVFGIADYIFVAPEGEKYYAAMPDVNFFGEAQDTLTSPRLNIGSGDTYSFKVEGNQFFPATHTVLAIDPITGDQTVIQNLPTSPGWQDVEIDLSGVQGIKRIAITSTVVSGIGMASFDAFQSTASLHRFDNDLSVVDGSLPFMANLNVAQDYVCRVKNEGINAVAGANYTVRLMAGNTVIAQVNGVDLQSWEESQIVIPHTFTDLGMNELHFEIDYQADDYTDNNTYRMREVYVLPTNTIMDEMAPKDDIPNLNFPFNGTGNTNSLGTDDLSQSLYRQEAFENGGSVHGIVYHYDRLLKNDYVQHLPLQVWAGQVSEPSLNTGFVPTTEMVLVFDGVVEIISGDDQELYIPFDEPVAFTGLENLVIQNYQYDVEWPPSIMRFNQSLNPEGDTRSVSMMDVFEVDPNDPGNFYNSFAEFPYVHFVISPETSTSDISGTVVDQNGDPLENAAVTVDGTGLNAQTDIDGTYQLPALPYGSYVFQAELFGYDTEQQAVEVENPLTTVDFVLNEKALLQISGRVVGSNDPATPLEAVEIQMEGYTSDATLSGADGTFGFQDVYGNEEYTLTFSVYGYETLTLVVSLEEDNVDLGDVVLDQRFLSAYDVIAVLDDNVNVNWEDPQLGSIAKVQGDLDQISNSYTNEPLEEVWLGNLFEIDQMTTISSAELRTEVFELAMDFVTVDVIDVASGEILASSQPFLLPHGETFEVDLPNIVVDQDVMIGIHWVNNLESTNALAIDYSSPSVQNMAAIKYPGSPIELFNEFTGNNGLNMAFLVRMNVQLDGPTNPNAISLGYNVYRGLASQFPDITDWELLTDSPIFETSYEDVDWWTQTDQGELYRFAVEAVYPEGLAEVTFSNALMGAGLGIGENDVQSSISLYPNPAVEVINLAASGLQTLSKLRIYDMSGKIVYSQEEVPATGCSIQVGQFASGMYMVHLLVNNEDVVKKVVIGH